LLILELNPEHTVEGNEEERFHLIQKGETLPRDSEGLKKDVTIRRPTGYLELNWS
jgi:hypothetical protein